MKLTIDRGGWEPVIRDIKSDDIETIRDNGHYRYDNYYGVLRVEDKYFINSYLNINNDDGTEYFVEIEKEQAVNICAVEENYKFEEACGRAIS